MRNISTVESRDNATLSALSAERGRYFREMEGIYRSLRDDPTHMLSPSELDRFDEISNHVLSLDRQVAEIRGIPFDSVEDEAMNNIPLIMPREDLERIAKDMAQPPKEFRRSMRPCVQSDSLSDGLPSDIAGLVERNGRVSFAVAKSIRDLRAIQRTPLLENGDTGMLAMPVEMLPPVSAYRMPMPWLLELIPTVPVSGGSVQQNRIDYASPSGNAAAQVPEGGIDACRHSDVGALDANEHTSA
jgi:hypothetical protein